MKSNGLEHLALTLTDLIRQGEIDNSLNAFTQPLIKVLPNGYDYLISK
jgi:hypothetical protein